MKWFLGVLGEAVAIVGTGAFTYALAWFLYFRPYLAVAGW